MYSSIVLSVQFNTGVNEVTGLPSCSCQRTLSVQYTTGTILATDPQAYIQFCLWHFLCFSPSFLSGAEQVAVMPCSLFRG
jgi:hypothetical protein